MKKVINGKMYNTETAERLAEWDNGRWGSFDACSETLYRKRNGELFLHGDGGCRSPYSKFSGDGLEVGSQAIIRQTMDKNRRQSVRLRKDRHIVIELNSIFSQFSMQNLVFVLIFAGQEGQKLS